MDQEWNSRTLGCCIGALLWLCAPAMARGQVTTATMYGNVTDGSGVNTTITSPNFGRFTSTRGACVVQLNTRLPW